MKALGINIDGVVRDFHTQFDKHYRKVFIHNESLIEMNDDFTVKVPTDEEFEEFEKNVKKAVEDKITLPIDTFDLLNHYKFEPKIGIGEERLNPREALEEFMFDTYPFQIFGQAEQHELPRAVLKPMDYVNQIQNFGLKENLFETILLSRLRGKSISSTYYFLFKASSVIKKVIFVENEEDKWDYCDAVIDVMPEVFQNKPDEKTSIKLNRLYNQWDKADYDFDYIKEVNDEDFLKKLF